MTGANVNPESTALDGVASRALDKARRYVSDVPEHVLREAFRWVKTTEPCRLYGAEYFAAICIREAIKAGALIVAESLPAVEPERGGCHVCGSSEVIEQRGAGRYCGHCGVPTREATPDDL